MKVSALRVYLFRPSARTLAASAAAAALGMTVLFGDAAFAQSCRTVSGTVQPLQPAPCPGFIGSCFQTTFSGDIQGSSLSALTAVLPGKTEGEIAFSAQSSLQIQAPNGVVNTTDVGTGSGCKFVNYQPVCTSGTEKLVITSGERAYRNASGEIILSGGYMNGQPGTYQGQICIGG